METVNEYDQQANDFLTATGTTFKAEFLKHGKHFENDTETRDIYKITLKRGARIYTFTFGQSIAKSGFYYTKGVQKIALDRKYLNVKNLPSIIKRHDFSFLGNGKSDKIHRPKAPTPYDVLACLTKYDPETFDDFCDSHGYDRDSHSARKIYKAVVKEWQNVAMLYNDDEIQQLAEIQ